VDVNGPFDQHAYRVRLEWGREGVTELAGSCAVLVVVDVLSFSTSVSVAVSRGAAVVPLPWRDARAAEAARSAGAVLAGSRRAAGWSLSPSSLRSLPAGTRLALPSPNGATLSALAAGAGCRVLAGCLRNASAVAAAAARLAGSGAIAVVPAGERWLLEGAPLRPAVEDLVGAGAVVAGLRALGIGPASPEAVVAADVFRCALERGLLETLTECSSGRELAADGFSSDVALAAEHDVTDAVPLLADGEFRAG
jgi:2-phosphosulfolactate phosphatase